MCGTQSRLIVRLGAPGCQLGSHSDSGSQLLFSGDLPSPVFASGRQKEGKDGGDQLSHFLKFPTLLVRIIPAHSPLAPGHCMALSGCKGDWEM